MPYYKVYYRWVDSRDKTRHGHTLLDAQNKDDAKKRVIKGEKPRLIAVDRVIRQ